MTTAVLVMAYGTPAGPEQVEAFYTDVRRGRPPSPEQLAELVARYAAIGGVSPLTERTAAQIAALQRHLDAVAPGAFRTYYGTKHGQETIEQAVAEIAAHGCKALVGMVLAPHYSQLSIGEYVQRAREAAEKAGITSAFIEHWHDEPVLVSLLAARVRDARSSLPEAIRDEAAVVFTAHSLPARIGSMGDPYPDQLAQTAALVAAEVPLETWHVGWQSAGRTGEEWIGPDISEMITAFAADSVPAVVVCPAGFTSDHLEILYDLDVVAARLAASLGMAFRRTASLNDEDKLFAALAARVAETAPPGLGTLGGTPEAR